MNMFYRENLQQFVPPSILNFNPNCSVMQNRFTYNTPIQRNSGPVMYRSFPTPPNDDLQQYSSGFSMKSFSINQMHTGSKHEQGSICRSAQEQESKPGEKFNNELNHPLMLLDCQKNPEMRSLSPPDTGAPSSPGHYQNRECQYRVIPLNSGTEPRGTKRLHQTPVPSRSPSPHTLNQTCNTIAVPPGPISLESVASRAKRRYQEASEGLSPIPHSTCHLNINTEGFRPDNLLNRGEWDRVSHAIWSKFVSHEQKPETLKRKLRLREMVHNYIRSYMHQCGLYIVGSSVSGFGGESSDMDLCLVVSTYEIDQRFHALGYLYRVQKALKQCRFLTKLDVIRAKVPILRFHDTCTNLEVDLNCNNIVGIRNTHLLKAYAQLDWRVRPMVLVVKLWARQHDINDAKSMTISSYSLTLMVIHYLQYGVNPPVLPCLQKARMERFWPDADICRLTPFTDEELKPLRSNNNLTLGELFAGFLDYFACKFNFSLHAISIRIGGTLAIDQCRHFLSPKNEPHHWKFLCIEEPFDRTNTAHSVYDPSTFQRIVDIFRDSSMKIREVKELSCLLA